jgi:hypothetical protein
VGGGKRCGGAEAAGATPAHAAARHAHVTVAVLTDARCIAVAHVLQQMPSLLLSFARGQLSQPQMDSFHRI